MNHVTATVAAICTHLCDLAPDAGLIGQPATRERALHAQWISFAQSEMESYLWHSAKHSTFYPEEKRVEAVLAPNREEFRNGAAVLDAALAETMVRFASGEVPRPPHWGGYRVEPACVEFWTERPGRLHDRLRFTRTGS